MLLHHAAVAPAEHRTLILSRREDFSFLDVQSLLEIRSLPRPGSFEPGKMANTPNGKLLAVELLPGVINLNEVATGRTVARLTSPPGDNDGTNWMRFDPCVLGDK